MVSGCEPFDIRYISVQRFGTQRRRQFGFELPCLCRAAAQQDKTQTELLRFFKQNRRTVERHARVVHVVVIGHRRTAGTRKFDQTNARREPEASLVE